MTNNNFNRRIKCPQYTIIIILPARHLLSNICAKIINKIWNSLHSKEFIEKHKTSTKAFVRNRKLPFHNLVLFLLGNLKSSYNKELDRFYKQINGGKIGCSDITKSAVTAARKHLKADAFLELNNQTINTFEKEATLDTWYGFRLLAIDGTTLRLPNIDEIREHFGTRSGGSGKPCPLARMSELYDPLNKLTISGIVSPIAIGEREQAHQLFLHLMPGDLVLLDRGYPAFSLFKAIISMNADFCARMNSHWKIVKNFLDSGLKEQIVDLTPTESENCEGAEIKTDQNFLTVRLVRIELSSEETEVLATTLLDSEKYPHELFAELYHQRWFIEEDYKILKISLELENFSGKTVHSIYQDIYAQLLAKNIVSCLSFDSDRQIRQSGKKNLYKHKINFTYALSKTKEVMALLFYSTKSGLKKLLTTLEILFKKKTEPIRPGRKYPRNHRIFKRVYHFNRKGIA